MQCICVIYLQQFYINCGTSLRNFLYTMKCLFFIPQCPVISRQPTLVDVFNGTLPDWKKCRYIILILSLKLILYPHNKVRDFVFKNVLLLRRVYATILCHCCVSMGCTLQQKAMYGYIGTIFFKSLLCILEKVSIQAVLHRRRRIFEEIDT